MTGLFDKIGKVHGVTHRFLGPIIFLTPSFFRRLMKEEKA